MLRCRSGGAVQSEEYGPCNVALPHARRRDRAPLGQWTYHLRIGLDRTKYVARYLLQSASARSASLGEMRSQSSNTDCRVEATANASVARHPLGRMDDEELAAIYEYL